MSRARLSIPAAQRAVEPGQRGASMLFALITLMAMSLAALALIRSVDTSTTIVGNVGFKQDATNQGDQSAQQALVWLSANGSALNADAPTAGYYASSLAGLDATGQQVDPASAAYATSPLIDWDDNNCNAAGRGTCVEASPIVTLADGVSRANYVITRMCLQAGDPGAASNSCLQPATTANSGSAAKGELNEANPTRFSSLAGPYYRIIVRVVGARSTTSFTETTVHF